MRTWQIIGLVALVFIVIAGGIGAFVYWTLPKIESAAFAGFVGVLVGTFAGVFGSLITGIVGLWKTAKDTDEKLKDRISNHALQLTQMDYDLRQKSLESSGGTQQFLAPVKVYRIFYRALYELHTTGGWPEEALQAGLLGIFELGGEKGKGIVPAEPAPGADA